MIGQDSSFVFLCDNLRDLSGSKGFTTKHTKDITKGHKEYNYTEPITT